MTQLLTKAFSLGDVLSITTDRLVSERHMDGVYDILNWMTGDNLFTHQLPRAARACKPILVSQFPRLDPEQNPELMIEVGRLVEMLESVETKTDRECLITGWLMGLKATHGDNFEVVPLRQWESRNPVAELVEMVGEEKILTVISPPSEEFPANLPVAGLEQQPEWPSELDQMNS